ncbi:4Fe-4S dicluster domain-containing protein [uncultured Paludibaculum sp.]|uniref:4Fe-4S dicluster domain-containing protein n=1 Tax=uncultured Paludibaculum sp. TaxID=1765020 RepID=UPI002AAB380A|nr:4Fe-4S dicluster domain-containing protein [uncultured Paludibaculum sp.]
MPNLSQSLRAMGVVGAGGAGFPTEVKAKSQVEYILANGAECEPLLHKDFELMKRYPAEMVSGMARMIQVTSARQGRFCIKEKNKEAVDAVTPHAKAAGIEMTYLGDFYPSGDEYEIVYAATGRLIPAAGIPLNVGCVVNNVETLYNVELAAQGTPVTKKFVSISGAVKRPCSFWAPIGCTFADLLAIAGGPTVPDIGIFVSGMMMGTLTFDLTGIVTKTTCGLIVLPREHSLVQRKSKPKEVMAHIGKSACDQCSYCTEFCPRYLLGYDVQPHKVMRTLGFTLSGKENWSQWGELCCSCGLCTLYACPEDLFPKEACDDAKVTLRTAGMKYVQQHPVRAHPMKEYRRVPQSMLRQRLNVEAYESHTPFVADEPKPARVRILTKQHAGKPATPVVAEGDRIEAGRPIARMNENELGADVHASITGRVARVTAEAIEIEA